VTTLNGRADRAARFAIAATLAAAFATFPPPVAAQSSFGSLTQLSGPFGCTNVSSGEDCAQANGLRGASSVAASPDGRNLYVAANNSGAVVTFRRNPRSGVIVRRGCLSVHRSEGCTLARAISGAFSVAVSPDGRHVYVAAFRAVAMFERDTRTGALRQPIGADTCTSQDGADGCSQGRGLTSAASVTVSPDGRNVYVASSGSSAVATFSRDLDTGEIRQLPGPEGCISQGGSEGCTTGRALGGAFSIRMSPNGEQAYVAALNSNAVAVLERDPDDGALLQRRDSDACVSLDGHHGCAPGRGLAGPNGVTVSADGRNVYVASSGSSAVASFERDFETGAIDQLEGPLGCTSQGGLEGCSTGRALGGAYDVTTSLDGGNAYAVTDNAVVTFLRNPQSGVLGQLQNSRGCTSQGGTEGCATGRALQQASSIALTPDGRNAYVASYVSNGIGAFARNPQESRVRVRLRGMPRRCARGRFTVAVRIRSTLPMRRVGVRLNRRSLGSRNGTRRLRVRIIANRLRRGRHRLRVSAVDVGGNRGRRTARFRRC
jgi:DNA-binding beta-propeller fold protein YncE